MKMWVNPNINKIRSYCGGSEEECWCEDCEEHYEAVDIERLWEEFADTPVNKEEEIEERFLSFEPGTNRQEIWRWFDKRFPNGLGKYLDGNDENLRRCNNCGTPMKKGYYLGGEYACSDECALALYGGNKAQMEEDLSHADEDDGECYWTEWETYYND